MSTNELAKFKLTFAKDSNLKITKFDRVRSKIPDVQIDKSKDRVSSKHRSISKYN